jgi:hypothetical protein
MTVLKHTINREDTAANWLSSNPILALGTYGHETDTGKLKLGDGTHTWTQLVYVNADDLPIDTGIEQGINTYEGADGNVAFTNLGIECTIAALHAGDSYTGIKSVVTAAAATNANGAAAYFETDVTGTVAGTLYGAGSWINFNAAVTTGANMVCAQDNGIYGIHTGTYTSTKMIIGMRMELVSDTSGGCVPGSLFLFSTNIYGTALTAMFDVNVKVDLGWVTAALSGTVGHVPLFKEVSTGTVHYVNVYSS